MGEHTFTTEQIQVIAAECAAIAGAIPANTTSKSWRQVRASATKLAGLLLTETGTPDLPSVPAAEVVALRDSVAALEAELAEHVASDTADDGAVDATLDDLAEVDAQVTADVADLRDVVASLASAVSALVDKVAEALTRVAALEPGAGRVPLLGAATTRTGGWDALKTLAGGDLAIRRSFAAGFPAFAASPMAADVGARASVYSFKTTTAEMGTTATRAAVAAFVDAIPAGHRTWLCWRHEPEDDGEPSPAAWRAAFDAFAEVVLGRGRPEVVPTCILMDWTWNPQSGRTVADWLPSDRRVCVGIDPYTWKVPPTAPTAPGPLFDPILADLRGRGYTRLGIAETGVSSVYDAATRLAWMNDLTTWAHSPAAAGVEFVCYFDSDVGATTKPVKGWFLDGSMAQTLGFHARGGL